MAIEGKLRQHTHFLPLFTVSCMATNVLTRSRLSGKPLYVDKLRFRLTLF